MKRFIVIPLIILSLIFSAALYNFMFVDQRIGEIKGSLEISAELIERRRYVQGREKAENALRLWENLNEYIGVVANSRDAERVSLALNSAVRVLELGEYSDFLRSAEEASFFLDTLIYNESISLANII